MEPAHPAPVPGTRFRVHHVAETGSTNADAVAAAAGGEPEGLVIVADHQTAGRGRLGRSWEAQPRSSLLMSVLLRPPTALGHLAVCAVGCAAAAACEQIAGVTPGLKWPNDLVAGQRKLGGILAEATAASGNMTALVVGLGLNVRHAPDLPEVTALDQLGPKVVEIDDLLNAILIGIEERYAALVAHGAGGLLDEYRNRCVTIGQRVRIEEMTTLWRGVAVGVADDGALLVRTDDGRDRVVSVGDVVHLREGD